MKKFLIFGAFFFFFLNILNSSIALGQTKIPELKLTTTKNKYLHYELVKIIAYVNSKGVEEKNLPQTLTAQVFRDKNPVTGIGQLKDIPLIYNPSLRLWEGNWPVPWNAPVDNYTIKIDTAQFTPLEKPSNKVTPRNKMFKDHNLIPPSEDTVIKQNPLMNLNIPIYQFEITRRPPPKIDSDIYILTMESTSELKTIRMPSPDGKEGGWEQIIEWAKFIGANTIWYLGGQTAGWTGKIDEEFPWNKSNLKMLPKFAQEAQKNSLKFGVWVAAYLTFGKKEYRVSKYTYAYNYDEESDELVHTARTISLSDKKRRQDIIDFIKKVSEIPGVDYIGLDYIRNAFGGYELVDEFVQEMSPELPPDWESYSKNERMRWLAIKVIRRKDLKLIDQWNWWRAHYVAHIVKEIKDACKVKQPLWVFTLSWEKGWQHGQDPIMMNDAGVDIDAVMLYEADNWQFDTLLKEWNNYVTTNQVNLIVGNQVDWVVHQSTLMPSGPEVFYNRIKRGAEKIYKDSLTNPPFGETSPLARGIFWHDLGRAFWGRIGPYPALEWAIAGGAAFSQLRLKSSATSLATTIKTPEKAEEDKAFNVEVTVQNLTEKRIEEIDIDIPATVGITCNKQNKKIIPFIEPKETVIINFTAKANDVSPDRNSRYMVSAITNWTEDGTNNKYFCFNYINIAKPEKLEKTISETP